MAAPSPGTLRDWWGGGCGRGAVGSGRGDGRKVGTGASPALENSSQRVFARPTPSVGPRRGAGAWQGACRPQPHSSGTSWPAQAAQGPAAGAATRGETPSCSGLSRGLRPPYSPQSWAGRTAACSRTSSSHMPEPERGRAVGAAARQRQRQRPAEPSRDSAAAGRCHQGPFPRWWGQVSRNGKGLRLEAKRKGGAAAPHPGHR